MVGSFFPVPLCVPAGVQDETCIAVGAKMLLYRDYGDPPAVMQRLVNRRFPAVSSQRRALAGIELVPPR
jgi:hypothetical protein